MTSQDHVSMKKKLKKNTAGNASNIKLRPENTSYPCVSKITSRDTPFNPRPHLGRGGGVPLPHEVFICCNPYRVR